MLQDIEEQKTTEIAKENQLYKREVMEILPLQRQEDIKPPIIPSGRENENRYQGGDDDDDEREESEIVVINSDSESSDDQTGASGPPTSPGRPESQPPAGAQTESGLQADAPRPKRTRHKRLSGDYIDPTSYDLTTDSEPAGGEAAGPSASTTSPRRKVKKRKRGNGGPFEGIIDPVVSEIYKIPGGRFINGYAVVVLPLGDYDEIGISRSFRDTDLVKKIPQCYHYDKDLSIGGWRDGYDNGGSKVTMRKFPCLHFKLKLEVPLGGDFTPPKERFVWIAAKDLRPLDLQANGSGQTKGVEIAKTFKERLRLIKEKRAAENGRAADETARTSAQADATGGQAYSAVSTESSTSQVQRQFTAHNVPRGSPRETERPSTRTSQNRTGSPNEPTSPQMPHRARHGPRALRTLAEINRQHPDPTPEASGSDEFPLPQRGNAGGEHAYGWVAARAGGAGAGWGGSAMDVDVDMDTSDMPHGLEVVTPMGLGSPDFDDTQTLRANDDLPSPAVTSG
ncbi:hypothetical protein GGR52DRAFT_558037 [Hypoxylon sp. FL1284]|nr:hypothetical protein GGR52DRAFT_558037 [Hypoxylon sp. FL1284]